MENARMNAYIARLQRGEQLSEAEREWLFANPLPSARCGDGWLIADMLPLPPGKRCMVMVQCEHADVAHPIVPTFTIPFESGGYLALAAVAGAREPEGRGVRSTKQSLRMLTGITAGLQCRSEAGLLMVSYQGWVPDCRPIPRWFESIRHSRFAMRREILTENMVRYCCRGADGTEDAFRFLVNWYELE